MWVRRAAPLTPEKIAFAWRTAVGPSVDNATTIALRESGKIAIKVINHYGDEVLKVYDVVSAA